MRQDMNFFSIYNNKNKTSDASTLMLIIFEIIVIGLIIFSLGYNSISIYLNNKEAEDYRAKLETEEIVKKVEESTEVNFKIDLLTNYDNSMDTVIEAVDSRDVVNTTLFKQLSYTLPSEVTFSAMNASSDSILITGTASSMKSIAEVEHNLRAYDFIASTHVGTIKYVNDTTFTFDITCYLEG